MTAKEKAKQLVDKYLNAPFNCKDCDMPYCDIKCITLSNPAAKQCALIAVDEIINNIPCREDYSSNGWVLIDNTEYWKEVKQEIENL